MLFRQFEKYFLFLVIITFLSLNLGCENQLPESLQDDEGYDLGGRDEIACSYLSNPLAKIDTVIVGNDTSFVTTDLYKTIEGAVILNPALELWKEKSDSLIESVLDTLVDETALLMNNSVLEDTIYAVYFNETSESNKLYTYISWDITDQNYDVYINVDLFNRDGEHFKLISDGMGLDLVAGCTIEAELAGETIIVPRIRARYVHDIPEGDYLVRFYVTEPTGVNPFKILVLH